MKLPTAETQNTILRFLAAITLTLVIYTCFIGVGMIIEQNEQIDNNTELLGHHDEYIKGEIIKVVAAREQAKGEAFKLYMETGDKSKMIELGME